MATSDLDAEGTSATEDGRRQDLIGIPYATIESDPGLRPSLGYCSVSLIFIFFRSIHIDLAKIRHLWSCCPRGFGT